MNLRAPLLALVALALVIGAAGSSLATTRDDVLTPTLPRVSEGEMYDRTNIIPQELAPVPLPVPDNQAQAQAYRPGPLVMGGGERLSQGLGSALVAPAGGSIWTPQQRADREIRHLIRRLD